MVVLSIFNTALSAAPIDPVPSIAITVLMV